MFIAAVNLTYATALSVISAAFLPAALRNPRMLGGEAGFSPSIACTPCRGRQASAGIVAPHEKSDCNPGTL
jgi:hypothetical protein